MIRSLDVRFLILILNESLRVQDGKVSLQNISRRLFLGMKKGLPMWMSEYRLMTK